MVDAFDSKSNAVMCEGSSPSSGTEKNKTSRILEVLFVLIYIFPTILSPGLRVSSPGSHDAGHTLPPCSRTNCAALIFLINSRALRPMELSLISIPRKIPSGSTMKVPLKNILFSETK